jgi:Mn2+/Fe2+ NRAMP family transporter
MDTAIGAGLAAVAAIATVVATAPLFAAHVDVSQFASGADFATALRPLIGETGATLFALGIVEAGLVAAMTISTSSSYSLAEAFSARHSLNLDFDPARRRNRADSRRAFARDDAHRQRDRDAADGAGAAAPAAARQ